MARRKRYDFPDSWPRWNKICEAPRRKGLGPCKRWAVIGMPTCTLHGSGGVVHQERGRMRYLAWIVTGGPQNMPVDDACRIALAAWYEAVIANGKGTPDQQYKAAMWLLQAYEGGEA